MDLLSILLFLAPLAPPAAMLLAAGVAARWPSHRSVQAMWSVWSAISATVAGIAGVTLVAHLLSHNGAAPRALSGAPGMAVTTPALWLAVLVQGLGTVVGGFSARYLRGEPGQRAYAVSLATVLASVHVLLLADHWAVLLLAWGATGSALHRLLLFYPERPFARIAAHKKRITDRVADGLLLVAAAISYRLVGSGSLTELMVHVQSAPRSVWIDLVALCVVLAVVARTALIPVHGWLTQVMEAPTPVSALLHAGVVNLGGFVLVRMAPLLEASTMARAALVLVGVATVLFAGMVMMTRVSIKVRLAWSTIAQMGFMVLECGLGLYQLALVHLMGHSLYKAHAFLAASSSVRTTRVRMLARELRPAGVSVVVAPFVALVVVMLTVRGWPGATDAWPWWWSVGLACAWAPLLWWSSDGRRDVFAAAEQVVRGMAFTALLTAALLIAHMLPLGTSTVPNHGAGLLAVAALTSLYAIVGITQHHHARLERWRRWSFAGFYLDESYTRLAVRLWPRSATLPTVHTTGTLA